MKTRRFLPVTMALGALLGLFPGVAGLAGSPARPAARGMGGSIRSPKTLSSRKPKTSASPSHKTKAAVAFDVAASVQRHYDRYQELLRQEAKRQWTDAQERDDHGSAADDNDHNNHSNMVTTEYMVAVRDRTRRLVPDWVPVGQLAVGSHLTEMDHHQDDQALAHACVSLYCRELSHVAALGSRTFQQLPRQHMEYAMEPLASFEKHVYERLWETPTTTTTTTVTNTDAESPALTVEQAKAVLQLPREEPVDLAAVKRQYRRLAFQHHPDRHEDKAAAGDKYAQVQAALETLTQSGRIRRQGASWYESLGGKERNDFVTLALLPLSEAQRVVEASRIHCGSAVMAIDPEIVQNFLARGSVASRSQ